MTRAQEPAPAADQPHREDDAVKRRNPVYHLQPLALALLLASGLGLAAQAPSAVPLYDNLGTHHYSITTSKCLC